jgi:hypothetical protein
MTEALATRRLTAEEARDLTEEVKADAAALWRKLLRLYEGGAHLALAYASWGDYFAEEFGQSKSHGYELLDAGRVLEAVETHSAIAERPRYETVARALAPVLRNDGPEAVADAWQEAVEQHGPTPTAREVREVVAQPIVPARKTRVALPEVMEDHDEAWTECRARFASGDIAGALDSALLAGRALGRVVRTLDGMSTEDRGMT